MRFLLCGACYLAAVCSIGAAFAAATFGDTVGFAALAIAALALSAALVAAR